MTSTLTLALLALCATVSSGAQFGYAPDEPIASSQDLIEHAQDQITSLANNFVRLETNAEKDANNLLKAITIQSSDPEGLQALVVEAKMAISQIKPAGIDVSSCESGNDEKYAALVNAAGPGTVSCLTNASASLQPYYQRLRQMLQISKDRSAIAQGNVTDCANKNKNNQNSLASCLQVVGKQVFDGRDILMAGILGEMAEFKNTAAKLVANLTVCTNAVQDKAISQSVAIIQASRECIRAKVNGQN